MKRLFVLGLVAVIGSVASAGLSLDVEVHGVDYAGWIMPEGTEITVKIVQDAPNPNPSSTVGGLKGGF